MNASFSRRANRSTGFTLVELMVALVVGLLLLAGVLQVLLGNRESFEAQKAMARVQENARLASFVLQNTIAQAGYRTDLSAETAYIFPATSSGNDLPAFQPGAFIAGLPNTHGQSDTLRIRFQAEGGVHNCRGTEIGSSDDPQMTDFEFYVNDKDTLLCRVIGSSIISQPLVENVDRFEVRYGLDTDDTPGVDRYVSDLSGWDATKIRSVRVELLLRSPKNDNVLPSPTTRQYTFSGNRSPVSFGPDRLGRLLLDQTIAVKNALK